MRVFAGLLVLAMPLLTAAQCQTLTTGQVGQEIEKLTAREVCERMPVKLTYDSRVDSPQTVADIKRLNAVWQEFCSAQ